jgi:hypothetical protein
MNLRSAKSKYPWPFLCLSYLSVATDRYLTLTPDRHVADVKSNNYHIRSLRHIGGGSRILKGVTQLGVCETEVSRRGSGALSVVGLGCEKDEAGVLYSLPYTHPPYRSFPLLLPPTWPPDGLGGPGARPCRKIFSILETSYENLCILAHLHR